MKILGISSATKIISIGLINEDEVLSEYTVSYPEAKTENIVLYIDEMISRLKIKIENLEAVSVTIGPGSYAGLRGGLAVAKSLAQTLNIPIVGISTLEAMAFNLVDIEGTIATVTDATRDDYNFALFSSRDGKLKRLTEDFVIDLDRLLNTFGEIKGVLYFVSIVPDLSKKILIKNPQSKIKFVGIEQSLPYGRNVARLGALRVKAGDLDNPLTLVPSYSHKPNIREYKA